MLSSTYINNTNQINTNPINTNPINTNQINTNPNNSNNHDYIKKTITIQVPKSMPILISVPIQQKNNNLNSNIDEYALNCNNFNPSKMSPPNIWKNRLMQRLESYNDIIFLNE